MIKSEGRHCNDAQSTQSRQDDCSIFSRTTRFYEPSVRPAVAKCYWTVQHSWFYPFLCPLLDVACSVATVRKLPRNRCSRWRTGGKVLIRIAKVPVLLVGNDHPRRPPTISRLSASIATQIHCLFCLEPTNDHISSNWIVNRPVFFR